MKEILRFHKALGWFVGLFLASVLLVGCGGEGESGALSGSKLQFDVETSNDGRDNYIKITSKNDEPVRIDTVILNRGNCGVNNDERTETYKLNDDRVELFYKKYPELKEKAGIGGYIRKLPTKDNKTVILYSYFNLDSPSHMKDYNNLTEEAQAIYDYKDWRPLLGFGEKTSYRIFCSYENVLEVTIQTDKGEINYAMGG